MTNASISMKILDPTKLLALGFINKVHGFAGEVSLVPDDDLSFSIDQFKSGFLFIQLDGLPVPFFVESIRERSGGILLKFETIDDDSSAKKIVGKKVLAEKIREEHSEDDTPSWFDLIGYTVTDEIYGDLGPIDEIQEYPMQYLARCMVNGREILFPLHEEMILEIDDTNRHIQIELPEGLLDVYLKD